MPDTLSTLLSAARSGLGWSLRDAERATGIPNAHLSQLETGTIRQPGIAVLAKLAKGYGIHMRRLAESAGRGTDWELVVGGAGLPEPVAEYGLLYSGGGYLTRNAAPEIERIYPVAEWVRDELGSGGHVFRRRIVVVEDWEEITEVADA